MEITDERREEAQAYYMREKVVEEMVRLARYREFAPTYPSGYGKRPDAVNLPGDFRSFVERGAIAFHGSVERWRNPLLIDTVENKDSIRTGWDLVIDIDCDDDLEFAKIAASELVREIKGYGVEDVSVKFSGNRGFHVGIRSENFPPGLEGREIERWYPELPRTVVDFLRDRLKERLAERFVEADPGVRDTVYEGGEPTPYELCDIENNWGDRHLFRLPYSINEKSWLVSLPIGEDEIMDFEKEDARIENVRVGSRFLEGHEEGSATSLVVEARDWGSRNREEERERFEADFSIPERAIPEEHFPPTIHNILEGLEDGRKRSLFILITFLAHVGYDWDSIERIVWEWNGRNKEALSESYVTSQLNWHRRQKEPLMPPNFDARGFYRDIGVYEEDPLTENVSNPVSYAFASARDEEDEREEEVETEECPYCGKEYRSEAWLKKHVRECFG